MPKAYKPTPPCAELWGNFEYLPLTGELVRISKRKGVRLQPFGRISTKGYRYGAFAGAHYYAHRLTWAWLHGEDPGAFEVDHIDRNRANNTAWNLRKVPANKQALNTRCYRNNALGVPGVKQMPGTSSYMARARVNRKAVYLGSFPTIEQASQAYEKFRAERISRITQIES